MTLPSDSAAGGRARWPPLWVMGLLLVGVAIFASSLWQSPRSDAQRFLDRLPDPQVTLADYEALKEGMSLEQVRATLGPGGTETSRMTIAGDALITYEWTTVGGGRVTVILRDGRLSSKSEHGLR